MPPQKNQYPKVTVSDVIREYFRVAKKYLFTIILASICVVLAVVAGSILTPIFYKHLFDVFSSSTSLATAVPELIRTIVTILLLNLASWTFVRIHTFAVVHYQAGTMNRLRQYGFEYVIGHSYSFFNNSFSGSLVQRINRFMRSFERVTDRFFGEVIPILVRVVGICIVLWQTNPIFSLAIIVWMIVFFILSFLFTRWKLPYDIKASELESRASAALSDSLSNHTTIQLFDRQAHEAERFGGANTEHITAVKKKWTMASIIDSIQALLNIILEFVIFYVAIRYWGAGVVTVGTFVLIQMYILGLMNSFWGWSRILRDIYESFADAKEMVEIIKLDHGIKDSPSAKILSVPSGAISLDKVSFNFNAGSDVLQDLSLEIKAGERVALIGPSGAGKSTLVRLILRLYDVQGGGISIDGQDIKSVTQGSLREAISFVPQDPILFHRSLKENIKYGRLNATDEEVIQASKLAHCHEFISSLPYGYDTYVGERGVKLSGGERQRVAIARAILKNAPILILDEATSSLDSHSEVLIQEALDVLMRNKTVIVIAHRLSTIRKMNRIVVLEKGRIIEEGSHEELVSKNGLYAHLWSLQSHGFLKDSAA